MPVAGFAHLTDVELARRSADRSARAAGNTAQETFHVLYERHSQALLAFIAARTPRSRRDDVFQAVWLRVWEKLASFRDGSFRAWLFQIARNYLIDESRRQRTDSLPDDRPVIDDGPTDPAHCLLDGERQAALQGCLTELSDRERDVITGLLQGTGYDDLCESLGIDHNAAYKATHAARAKLTDCVKRKLE